MKKFQLTKEQEKNVLELAKRDAEVLASMMGIKIATFRRTYPDWIENRVNFIKSEIKKYLNSKPWQSK